MRKVILLTSIFVINNNLLSQVNRYTNIDFSGPKYQNEIVYIYATPYSTTPDFSGLAEAIKQRNDNNKALRDALINCIFRLKSQTSDEGLLYTFDSLYYQLKNMKLYNRKAAGELDLISLKIKEEVDRYNRKVRENNTYNNGYKEAK